MFDSVTVTRPQIEASKLRALGVTSLERAPQLPAVPPIKDTVPGYEVTSWTALATPKGLPAAVAERLHTSVAKVLRDADVIRQLASTGGVASPASPADTKSTVAGQIDKWKKVIKTVGIPQQ